MPVITQYKSISARYFSTSQIETRPIYFLRSCRAITRNTKKCTRARFNVARGSAWRKQPTAIACTHEQRQMQLLRWLRQPLMNEARWVLGRDSAINNKRPDLVAQIDVCLSKLRARLLFHRADNRWQNKWCVSHNVHCALCSMQWIESGSTRRSQAHCEKARPNGIVSVRVFRRCRLLSHAMFGKKTNMGERAVYTRHPRIQIMFYVSGGEGARGLNR